MIRKNIGGDISEEEFEKVLKPFIDDYDNFVYSYILPEVIAYYLANSFKFLNPSLDIFPPFFFNISIIVFSIGTTFIANMT